MPLGEGGPLIYYEAVQRKHVLTTSASPLMILTVSISTYVIVHAQWHLLGCNVHVSSCCVVNIERARK